jgi:tetratricopeptide (TPR) repeat protein
MNPARAICVLALALAACQAPPMRRAPEYSSDLVAEGKKLIAQAPARDRNLWRLRVALLALKEGRHAEARELFDQALPPAGTVLIGDATTRRARGLFAPEKAKVFYGEPFERAMGWFYRGLLYWRDGEPDNARACFRTAQLFDAAPDRDHRGDWILMDYLDGLASAKLGGDSRAALQRARAAAGKIQLPDYDASANVLVFLQFGYGPLKKSGGDVGERIIYAGGNSRTQSARVRAAGRGTNAPALDNLTFQATTRGMRQMDWVLARKARVKKTADLVGDVSFLPGVILAQPEGTRDVGLALLGAGIAAKAVGGSTQPRSDTRTWNNLPQHLAFAALRLPPGSQPLEVEFFDADNNLIPALGRTLTIEVKTRGDTVVFVADK